MRATALIAAAALVFAACSSASDPEPGTAATETTPAAAEAAASGGSAGALCDTITEIIVEVDAMNLDDADTDPEETIGIIDDLYRRMEASAPDDIKTDVALVREGTVKTLEWWADPTGEFPLSDEETTRLDEADARFNDYVAGECGIDISNDGTEESLGDTGSAPGSADQYSGTHTITFDGETYTEELNGDMEVECDMIGDTETGSINVYLTGSDFSTSVSSADSGTVPGTYEGIVWAFSEIPELDDNTLGLHELDGTFVLDDAYAVDDYNWYFSGSFSAAAFDDPSTTLEATFSCVGPTDF